MAFLGLDKLAGYVAGGAKLADKTAKDEGKLLYPSFLNYDLSADDNWSIVSGQNKYVVADIVSYDSSTPLKKRDRISVYSGKLPKRAIKRALNESEIMQFKSLRNNGAAEEQLAGFIFKDTPFCVMGIENSIEFDFLSLLSGQPTLVYDETNTKAGEAIRLQVKGAEVSGTYTKASWEKAIDAADERMGAEVAVLSKATFNKLKDSTFAKDLHSQYVGVQTVVSPTREQFLDEIKSEYGVELIIIDTKLRVESNGKQTMVQPFADDVITFLPSRTIGRAVYTMTAEHDAEFRNDNCVAYTEPNQYSLLAVEHKTEPLRLETRAQAIILPVFDEIDNMVFLKLK